MEKRYNVCFVCTGNACRSPLAETVLKEMVSKEPNLNIDIWSCGTLDWGTNPRDEQMSKTAASMGYIMSGTTSYMNQSNLLQADRIIVFSNEHRDKITQILDSTHWSRIILFDMLAFGQLNEVEDPCFQSDAVYERVARHIEEGCRNIVSKWLVRHP